MRVILTGGGTGGHLYPGLAIVEEMMRRTSCDVHFIGTRYGLEAHVVPKLGYAFHQVWIRGLARGRILKNILFPLQMMVSLIQAILLVIEIHPDVIIGTGGYVSWPVIMAGILLCRETVIQEQNRRPGLVTRILAPWVRSVHLTFKDSVRYFRKKSHLHVSGNPTRDTLDQASRQKGFRFFNLDSNRKTLFVFGGSQGALAVNRAVTVLADTLMKETDIQILWAAGPRWQPSITDIMKQHKDRIRVYPFIDEMGLAYQVSDLVVCRSGATTVAEITRLGIPAIFIPFPGAAGGHQEQNARLLQESGAAVMVLEEDLSAGQLKSAVLSLLRNSQKRKKMKQKAKKFGEPQAAQKIVDTIFHQLSVSV
jgi:UDP-N-acetylglucosamine--N-acetylmuramyl-(pentapeptide) pyrophosphoryl-undecaprenol N-acetylglucosamine transferase